MELNATLPAVRINQQLRKRMRITAAWEGLTMSEFTRRAIQDRLDEMEPAMLAELGARGEAGGE